MSKNYIGSTGIKKVFNLLKNKIYSNLPFIGNFPNQKELLNTTNYTAEYNCWVYASCATNNELYGQIVGRVSLFYVFLYQNPSSTEGIGVGFSVFLKKGDVLEILGSGLRNCDLYIHYK